MAIAAKHYVYVIELSKDVLYEGKFKKANPDYQVGKQASVRRRKDFTWWGGEPYLDGVDFIVGTFSKTLGGVGGFCVARLNKLDLAALRDHIQHVVIFAFLLAHSGHSFER